MKKVWICLALTLALLSTAFAVSASEAGEVGLEVLEEAQEAASDASGETGGADAASKAEPTESAPAGQEEGEESTDSSAGGIGATLLNIWDAHASEIFSALTLFGSLMLAYAYKKGLMPTLWGGLNRIAASAEEASERAKTLSEAAQGSITTLTEATAPVLARVESLCNGAETLAAQAQTLEERIREAEDDRALVKTLMTGVAEMLYGVFTAANLPQYAKEQLGQKYASVTAALGGSSHEESDTGTTV
jgi:hypothetical protein